MKPINLTPYQSKQLETGEAVLIIPMDREPRTDPAMGGPRVILTYENIGYKPDQQITVREICDHCDKSCRQCGKSGITKINLTISEIIAVKRTQDITANYWQDVFTELHKVPAVECSFCGGLSPAVFNSCQDCKEVLGNNNQLAFKTYYDQQHGPGSYDRNDFNVICRVTK